MGAAMDTPTPTDEQRVEDLLALLDLASLDEDRFEGPRKQDGVGRVFGGQVIAQALAAAERTVEDDRPCHSLHAFFLRGGSENHPIELAVDRQFDGRSFSNRRVVASQPDEEGGALRPILNFAASFQRAQKGLHHQARPLPDVPRAEDLPSEDELRARHIERIPEKARGWFLRPRPVDMRPVGTQHWTSEEPSEPVNHIWVRIKAPLPDDPRIHRAVLAYVSDMHLLGTSIRPHGLSWMRGELKSASLDHSVWFHEPFRMDEWLLYTMDSPWSGGARGFNRGEFYTADGRLVASATQEGMIRKVERRS